LQYNYIFENFLISFLNFKLIFFYRFDVENKKNNILMYF
jgi:hypothetical protein